MAKHPRKASLHASGEAAPSWVRVSAAPLEATREMPNGAVLIAQDVDRWHQLQARLTNSEALLSVATEVAGIGTFQFDPATGTFVWDKRLRTMWGVAADAPVDSHLLYNIIHPDDSTRVRATIGSCMSAPYARAVTIRYRVVRKDDGRMRRMSTTLRSIFEGPLMTTLIGATMAVHGID